MKTAKLRRNFWAVNSPAFSPRVRAYARRYDSFFEAWYVLARVAGRDAAHEYHRYRRGEVVTFRASALYGSRHVLRGTCGRLEYLHGMTTAELEALPVVRYGEGID